MTRSLRHSYKASPRLRRLARRTKNAVVAAIARAALRIVGVLSLERALRLGEISAVFLYRMLREQRRLALQHLRVAFGEAVSPAAYEHLARASFVNIARSFCELAKIDEIRARRDTYFAVEGLEHVERIRAAGKGTLVVTGHIGNWELLAAYFSWIGVPVAAVARRIYAEGLNQLLVEFRSRQGVETILRESPHSARQLLRAIEANAFLAMLIDQDTHMPSASVPPFGRLARTPVAAASLAIRRELSVLPMFIQRRAEGGHRIIVGAPCARESSGDPQADIRALTHQFNELLEAQIRKNPAEWVWWHRPWPRAPVAHLDIEPEFQYTPDDPVLRGQGGQG